MAQYINKLAAARVRISFIGRAAMSILGEEARIARALYTSFMSTFDGSGTHETPAEQDPIQDFYAAFVEVKMPLTDRGLPQPTRAQAMSLRSRMESLDTCSDNRKSSPKERPDLSIESNGLFYPGSGGTTALREPCRDTKQEGPSQPGASLGSQGMNYDGESIGCADEACSPTPPISQPRPAELPNLAAEVVFVIVCSVEQFLFAVHLGNVDVNQLLLLKALEFPNTLRYWIIGSFLLANRLPVVVSGSLADLLPPKRLMLAAFAWLTAWNIVRPFSISPTRRDLLFVARAMVVLAVGVLISASISILGRTYKPGIRRIRVFASMAAFSPTGF